MITYTISVSKEQQIRVRYSDRHEREYLEIDDKDSPCYIDQEFYNTTYGFDLNDFEIAHYKAHYAIWEHFFKESLGDWCLICEDTVHFKESMSTIKEGIGQLPEDWEVFFPYDKLGEEGRTQGNAPKIYCSRFGFFWGSYIYFIHKRAKRMLRFKKVNHPVGEKLLVKSFVNKIATIFSETGWFEYDARRSPSFLARQEALTNAVFGFSAWTVPQKEKAMEILDYLIAHAKKLDIGLVLHAGSLLGAIRHGGIMPWDDDVDLAMDSTQIERFASSVAQEGEVKVTKAIWKKTGLEYYKFWTEDGEAAEGYDYKFPFVDIWLLFIDREKESISTTDGYTFPIQKYMSSKETSFEGITLPTPNNAFYILDMMYPGWKEYIDIYTWCHRVKKHAFKRLRLPIEVDRNGKLIAPVAV